MSIPVARVADIAEQIRGVTYAKTDAVPTPTPEHLPILRAGNIGAYGLDLSDLVYVPASRVSANQWIRSGDVVIATSSGSLDIVGKAAQASADFPGGFGAFCKVLRPGSMVDARYFGHYFRTHSYRKKISTLAAGANINNLRNEHLNELSVPLHPLVIQQQIAKVLDGVDALRTKRRETVALLESLAQDIFLNMFGDPQENSHDWPSTNLSCLVAPGDRINYGVVQPGDEYDGGVALVRVGNLVNGRVDRARIKRIDPEIEAKYSRSRLKGNEVLVGCVGSIGSIAVATGDDLGSNIARAVARIPVESDVLRAYVKEYLRTKSVQRYFTKELRTVAQPTLNIKQLSETVVFMPPHSLQVEFVARIAAVERLKHLHITHIAELDALFASLQHRAFSGSLWSMPSM